MSILVVTGTDTGVGKTIVCAALAAAFGGTYVKLVQTGDEDDAADVSRLSGRPAHTLFRYDAPLAPASAGALVTAADIRLKFGALPRGGDSPSPGAGETLWILEGAGGALVRLGADGLTIVDVAKGLGAPVLVVARAGLGTLNHTALTVEALERRGVECPGVVIGSWPDEPGLAERSNLSDLPRYASRPLLGRVPEGAGGLDPAVFRARAPTWIEGKLV